MDKEVEKDWVGCVLANECSLEIINEVLDRFLPAYEPISANYAIHPFDEDVKFQSVEEMINFFIQTEEASQSFYWKKQNDNPERKMIGVDVTSDGKLVFSMTLDSSREKAAKYFDQLKDYLNSDCAVLTQHTLPDYTDGEDFKRRYQTVECLVENQ